MKALPLRCAAPPPLALKAVAFDHGEGSPRTPRCGGRIWGFLMTASAGRPLTTLIASAMLVAASVVSVTPSAVAGEVADKAAEAETLLGSGNAAGGFEALNAAVDAFWTAAPLTLRQVYFAAPDNAGVAAKRPDGPFRPHEAARIYIEPVGYGFTAAGGIFTIDLKTGIEIRTPGGLILAKSEDFGHLEWKGPIRDRTFNGWIGVDLPELKAGNYEFLLTVTDEASGKSATATLPFSVASD
jgi:hypothetical protein